MPKILKIIFIAIGIGVVVFILWSRHTYNTIYKDYFRLSEKEVVMRLDTLDEVECSEIINCDLKPGDILIRRYITERTETFNDFLEPYFIHVAVYLGNDEYFEALGLLEKPEDQIQVMRFSTSDWLYPDLKTFVIVRPKNYGDKLDKILEEYRNIAKDPEYVFGLPKEGKKETTCADVVVRTLQNEGLLPREENGPKIISPDYLFLLTLNDPEKFQIIGYNYEYEN